MDDFAITYTHEELSGQSATRGLLAFSSDQKIQKNRVQSVTLAWSK